MKNISIILPQKLDFSLLRVHSSSFYLGYPCLTQVEGTYKFLLSVLSEDPMKTKEGIFGYRILNILSSYYNLRYFKKIKYHALIKLCGIFGLHREILLHRFWFVSIRIPSYYYRGERSLLYVFLPNT